MKKAPREINLQINLCQWLSIHAEKNVVKQKSNLKLPNCMKAM